MLSVDYLVNYLMRNIRVQKGGTLWIKFLSLSTKGLMLTWASVSILVLFPLIIYSNVLTDIIYLQLLTSTALDMWLRYNGAKRLIREFIAAIVFVLFFILFLYFCHISFYY